MFATLDSMPNRYLVFSGHLTDSRTAIIRVPFGRLAAPGLTTRARERVLARPSVEGLTALAQSVARASGALSAPTVPTLPPRLKLTLYGPILAALAAQRDLLDIVPTGGPLDGQARLDSVTATVYRLEFSASPPAVRLAVLAQATVGLPTS
jgi:hypothetical protein